MFNKNLKESILKEANDRCKGTLVSTLGIVFTDVGEHFLEAKMKVTPNLHQPAGVLHGGATAALAETVGSSAAAIFSMKKNQMLRGVELSINHPPLVSRNFIGPAMYFIVYFFLKKQEFPFVSQNLYRLRYYQVYRS